MHYTHRYEHMCVWSIFECLCICAFLELVWKWAYTETAKLVTTQKTNTATSELNSLCPGNHGCCCFPRRMTGCLSFLSSWVHSAISCPSSLHIRQTGAGCFPLWSWGVSGFTSECPHPADVCKVPRDSWWSAVNSLIWEAFYWESKFGGAGMNQMPR